MGLYRSTNRALNINPPPALKLDSITKRFGNTIALDEANITVRSGTVHALLGENGAGKTTLMRVAFGMVKPDSGTISINASTGMVHQHFMLVPAMTVAENVVLGGKGRYQAREAVEKVRQIGEDTGLILNPHDIVGRLSISAQQRVEIVKALARDAKILILDEPTAVLAPAETSDLLKWLRGFTYSGGTVVLITHKLNEALSIADDVTVLRHGKTVLEKPAVECSIEDLAGAMLGSRASQGGSSDFFETRGSRLLRQCELQKNHYSPPAPIAISAQSVSVVDDRGVVRVKDASFSISGGEIVGIAGVEGSGQYHLLRALARRLPVSTGELTIPQNIGFIPEDRHAEAIILDFDLAQNVALKGAGERKGRIGDLTESTALLMNEFDVRATNPNVKARTLSGGNQQKLVVGRELIDNPKAIIAENPTRGLDIHATANVQNRLRTAAENGAAVVIYSTDIDEILYLASRVLVVFNGTITEVPPNREEIGRAMLGLSSETEGDFSGPSNGVTSVSRWGQKNYPSVSEPRKDP